jgi:hypothetical protein
MLIYTIIYFSKRFLTVRKVNNVNIWKHLQLKKTTKIDFEIFT